MRFTCLSPMDFLLIFHKFDTCQWVRFKHFPNRNLLFWIVTVWFGLINDLSMAALSFACCRTLANLFLSMSALTSLIFRASSMNSLLKGWDLVVIAEGNRRCAEEILKSLYFIFLITGIIKWEELLSIIKRFSRYKRLLGIKTHSNKYIFSIIPVTILFQLWRTPSELGIFWISVLNLFWHCREVTSTGKHVCEDKTCKT